MTLGSYNATKSLEKEIHVTDKLGPSLCKDVSHNWIFFTPPPHFKWTNAFLWAIFSLLLSGLKINLYTTAADYRSSC